MISMVLKEVARGTYPDHIPDRANPPINLNNLKSRREQRGVSNLE